jgi:DNA-binding NarL/FixJ family response regulator
VSVVEPQAGWAELAAGRWEDARTSFMAALDDEETAEGWEGLSWAAWWLDDAPRVFDARERAYRLYRARGDDADAARMATWLATDEFDFRGAAVVARGWLRRAHRLLDPLEQSSAHGWLAFEEGFLAHVSGETATARDRAAAAAEIGRRHGVPDLEMLGLALEGAALVACAEVGDGMDHLDEATTIALGGEASIPISGAWACCFLVSACMSVRDLERAVAWCDRIAEFADRFGSRYMLAFCRAEYGAVDVSRGRWDEAEAMLEAAIDDFEHSRPAWVGGSLVWLAELRRRQGRHGDSLALLDRAGMSSGAQRVRARIALDHGEAGDAAALVETLLRRTPAERRLERAPALEILVRARAALGDLAEAESALAELGAIVDDVGTPLMRAAAALAGAGVLSARGEHDAARPLLETAIDLFEDAGVPYEASCGRLELATTLAALGEESAARREAAGALESMRSLGAAGEVERATRILGELEPTAAPRLAGITPRELDVLRLLVEGLTNRQIAERLVVSEHTVHRHVTSILRKLDVPSRAAAAAIAARAGVVEPA